MSQIVPESFRWFLQTSAYPATQHNKSYTFLCVLKNICMRTIAKYLHYIGTNIKYMQSLSNALFLFECFQQVCSCCWREYIFLSLQIYNNGTKRTNFCIFVVVALLTVTIQTNSFKMAEKKVFFFDSFVECRAKGWATQKIKLYFLKIFVYYVFFFVCMPAWSRISSL